MSFKGMDHFIKPIDNLSKFIDEQAQILYLKLESLPLEQLDLPESAATYYKKYHHKRKFFSIQTAAELLYRSIKMKQKPVSDLTIMDYGAGVGSLYLLAKMLGCKKVIYNDIREDMTIMAKMVGDYLGVYIDVYIASDHTGTIEELNSKNISCDIILSRNVVEHIYDLNNFYQEMSVGQPDALIYFSTTANHHNPAMLWYHKRVHQRYEKEHLPLRATIIKQQIPDIKAADLEKVAEATRGLALYDLDDAINNYKNKGILPNPEDQYSNTCDPTNGLWAEHIIPIEDYRNIIESKGYKLTVAPAFWDTHYSSRLKNLFGKTMNGITSILGQKGGLASTAFIYIIAEKK